MSNIEITLSDTVANIDIIQAIGPAGPAGANGADGQGFINYSTSEVDTGLKWINGETIYQKTVGTTGLVANFPLATGLPLNTVGTIDRVISMVGAVHDTFAGSWRPLPSSVGAEADEIEMQLLIVFDRLQLEAGSNYFNSLSAPFVTIQYTKV